MMPTGTPEEAFSLGNAAFVDEDYALALRSYDTALALAAEPHPLHAEVLVKRSATLHKLGEHGRALADADAAIRALTAAGKPQNPKAWFRKGVAHFSLNQFAHAREAFGTGQTLDAEDKNFRTWIRKCEAELENAPPAASAPVPAPQEQFQPAGQVQAPMESNPVQAAPAPVVPGKIRYEWFQNDSYVTVSVFIKNVNKEKVRMNVNERSLSLTVPLPTGSEYSLELDLAHEVVPAKSVFQVLSTKVDVRLWKQMEGLKWGVLEGEDHTIPQPVNTVKNAPVPQYPTSSKKSKNWDALERDVKKSEEEEKPEGDAALQSLFQKIYSDASEETRRAMIKSYTESNGTCLSTNWSEVGKGKVECKPPDSMVEKRFEL